MELNGESTRMLSLAGLAPTSTRSTETVDSAVKSMIYIGRDILY